MPLVARVEESRRIKIENLIATAYSRGIIDGGENILNHYAQRFEADRATLCNKLVQINEDFEKS